MRISVLATLAMLAVPPAHSETVTWYLAHPDVRDRVHAACMDDPGHAMHVAACLNAATAIERSAVAGIPLMTEEQICAQISSEPYRRIVLHCAH